VVVEEDGVCVWVRRKGGFVLISSPTGLHPN
jgi:hypothetical protein